VGLDLDQARRQAKELLRAARSGDARALARFRADRTPRLADAQAAVARELGFSSWPALVAGVPSDARGFREATALHQVGLWGQAGTLRLLIDRGADVGAVTGPPAGDGEQEWTALDWTRRRRRRRVRRDPAVVGRGRGVAAGDGAGLRLRDPRSVCALFAAYSRKKRVGRVSWGREHVFLRAPIRWAP
jgi:hypothetical protein